MCRAFVRLATSKSGVGEVGVRQVHLVVRAPRKRCCRHRAPVNSAPHRSARRSPRRRGGCGAGGRSAGRRRESSHPPASRPRSRPGRRRRRRRRAPLRSALPKSASSISAPGEVGRARERACEPRPLQGGAGEVGLFEVAAGISAPARFQAPALRVPPARIPGERREPVGGSGPPRGNERGPAVAAQGGAVLIRDLGQERGRARVERDLRPECSRADAPSRVTKPSMPWRTRKGPYRSKPNAASISPIPPGMQGGARAPHLISGPAARRPDARPRRGPGRRATALARQGENTMTLDRRSLIGAAGLRPRGGKGRSQPSRPPRRTHPRRPATSRTLSALRRRRPVRGPARAVRREGSRTFLKLGRRRHRRLAPRDPRRRGLGAETLLGPARRPACSVAPSASTS